MLSAEKQDALRLIFQKYPSILAVYLFGSYAVGRENKFSDLDLGVLFENAQDKRIKLELLAELSAKDFCNVDLVVLNHASLLVRFEAVKYNHIIYKRADFVSSYYFSKTIREFFDFQTILKIQRDVLKERLLNG
jgi:hypothetical protein